MWLQSTWHSLHPLHTWIIQTMRKRSKEFFALYLNLPDMLMCYLWMLVTYPFLKKIPKPGTTCGFLVVHSINSIKKQIDTQISANDNFGSSSYFCFSLSLIALWPELILSLKFFIRVIHNFSKGNHGNIYDWKQIKHYKTVRGFF